jgi:hypothetical protein
MRASAPTIQSWWPLLRSTLRRGPRYVLILCLFVGDPAGVLSAIRAPRAEQEEELKGGAERELVTEVTAAGERPFAGRGKTRRLTAPPPRARSSRRPVPAGAIALTSPVQPGSTGAGAYVRC